MIAAIALGIALAAWIVSGVALLHAREARRAGARDRRIAELENDLGMGALPVGQLAQVSGLPPRLQRLALLYLISTRRR
jgi:hypothetical protein